MAVQRICKTSKDLRHEVDCFSYYNVQLTCCFRLYMGDRPFAGSGHMVRNKLHWDVNDAVGLSKERKVGLDL